MLCFRMRHRAGQNAFAALLAAQGTCALALVLLALAPARPLGAQIELYDRQHYYWRMEADGRLRAFDGEAWTLWGSQMGLPEGPVRFIHADEGQRLWVACADAPSLFYIDSAHQVRQLDNRTGIGRLNIVAAGYRGTALHFVDTSGSILLADLAAHSLKRAFGGAPLRPALPPGLPPQVRYDAKSDRLHSLGQAWQRSVRAGPVHEAFFAEGDWHWLSAKGEVRLATAGMAPKGRGTLDAGGLPELVDGFHWSAHARSGAQVYLGHAEGLVVCHADSLRGPLRLRPDDYDMGSPRRQALRAGSNYLRLGAVRAILPEGDSAWLATDNGLYLLDVRRRTLQRLAITPFPYPKIGALLRAGEQLIALVDGSLGILGREGFRPSGPAGTEISALAYDAGASRLWCAAAKGGLYHAELRGGRIGPLTLLPESQLERVRQLWWSAEGQRLWALCEDRLVELRMLPGAEPAYRSHALPAAGAAGLLVGAAGRAYLLAGGALWQRDTAYVDGQDGAERPSILLEYVKIDNMDAPLRGQRHFRLGFSKRGIRVSYRGVLASSEGQLRYKYRLRPLRRAWFGPAELLPAEWQLTEQRELFVNLESGTHLLEISALSREGLDSPQPLALRFEIAPPVWRQAWFYLLILLLLSTALGLALFGQRRVLLRRNQLLRMELRMLQAQMNTHFIANALTAIQGFILGRRTLDALNYIVDFHALMRLFLDASRSNEHLLQKELDILAYYIKMQQLFHDFAWDLELGEDVYPNELHVPTSLFQPFVENAIVHGLQHRRAGGKRLSLRFYRTAYELSCEVEDNGIGREASRRINGAASKFGKFSSGVSGRIIENRLRTLNAADSYKARIEYEDLWAAGKPAGTRVRIIVSLPKHLDSKETYFPSTA